MEDGNNRFYGFGEFRVDARRRVLSKNGEAISLSPRNFDLLLVMIENEGKILSHDDLLDKVWEGTFVEQANLKNAISVLRRVLGEQPNQALYIRTVPRRGYSFVAPVQSIPEVKPEETFVYEETVSEITVEEEVERDDAQGETLNITKALPPPAAPSHWRVNKLLAITAVVVILAGAGYGVWRWRSGSSPQLSADNIKITKLTNKGNLNGAVLSPSGNYFLYVTMDGDGSSLWAQQIATGSATKLTPKMKASFWYYAFSPDENYVYYTINNDVDAANNGYFKVPLFGGSPQRLSEKTDIFVPSPDSARIMFQRIVDGAMQYVNANPDYSDEKVVATFGPECRIWSMQWSPDGAGVLFAVRKFVGEKTLHSVIEYPVTGGEGRVIVPEMEKQITSAVWLAGKTSVLMSLREINGEIRQLWQYTPASGELRRVTNDENSYRALSISRDGKTVVTNIENVITSAMTADDDKYNFKPLPINVARMGWIGSAADGRFVVLGTSNGVESISVMDADGGNLRQITQGTDGIWLTPRISLNGRSVTFNATRNNRKQICRVDLDGRNLTQLTNSEYEIYKAQILTDNSSVIYESAGADKVDSLYKQAADGTVTRIVDTDLEVWDVSPDEQYVAYSATDPVSQKREVFVKSIATGWLFKVLDVEPVAILRWARDGRAIAYDFKNGDTTELRLISLDTAATKTIATFPGEQLYAVDWSFDGKRLTVVRGKPASDAVQISIGN